MNTNDINLNVWGSTPRIGVHFLLSVIHSPQNWYWYQRVSSPDCYTYQVTHLRFTSTSSSFYTIAKGTCSIPNACQEGFYLHPPISINCNVPILHVIVDHLFPLQIRPCLDSQTLDLKFTHAPDGPGSPLVFIKSWRHRSGGGNLSLSAHSHVW